MDKNKNCKNRTLRFLAPEELVPAEKGSAVLLAFSGGADSRALLHLLADYCKENNSPLYAAHVNHGIRGKEAEADRNFCVNVAKKYGIECFVLDADVPGIARERGESLEEAGRRVRYEFFGRLMREYRIPLLATAHNADDRLETLIFNIVRGTGLRGISSIPPSRPFENGYIIRPLILASKDEILEFCRENSLEYVSDSTNDDTAYSRNLIRKEIIPKLKALNSGVLENAARLNEAARECCEFIDEQALKAIEDLRNEPENNLNRSAQRVSGMSEFYSDYEPKTGDAAKENETEDKNHNESCLTEDNNRNQGIPLSRLISLHPAVRSRAITILCERECGITPEWVHVSDIEKLILSGKNGMSISLPGKNKAQILCGRLVFRKDTRKKTDKESESFKTALREGENILPCGKIMLTRLEVPFSEYKAVRSKGQRSDTVLISAEHLPLTARSMVEGDGIRQGGMTKKVRRLLAASGVPADVRHLHPIICRASGDILWIPGAALSDITKIPDKTGTDCMIPAVRLEYQKQKEI